MHTAARGSRRPRSRSAAPAHLPICPSAHLL